MGEPRTLTKRHKRFLPGRSAAVAAALCLTSATVALLPAASSAATGPGGETVAEGGHTAHISRTEYGIPHILARDFDGLGYGYGYAFAQDNVCELADQVVTLRGERSQFLGPGGVRRGRQPRERHVLHGATARGHRPAAARPEGAAGADGGAAPDGRGVRRRVQPLSARHGRRQVAVRQRRPPSSISHQPSCRLLPAHGPVRPRRPAEERSPGHPLPLRPTAR